jgi:arsenite methyltransferase
MAVQPDLKPDPVPLRVEDVVRDRYGAASQAVEPALCCPVDSDPRYLKLCQEIFRVLKKGGRAAISDIVSDEEVPQHLRDDPSLWSGCISGALTEADFLQAFEDAGFHGLSIESYQDEPWQTVEGIEFRSVTVVAWKGKQGACWDRNQKVVYKGPYQAVIDDDGHTFPRGQRVAVCEKTFELLQAGPYADQPVHVEPRVPVPLPDALAFECTPQHHAGVTAGLSAGVVFRSPRDSKGAGYEATKKGCEPGCC